MEYRFVIDTMLEKLARWLRLIGCDAIFNSRMDPKKLIQIANEEGRVFVTRRRFLPEDADIKYLHKLNTEDFEEQLKNMIEVFKIDYQNNLFTRCVECNEKVVKVDKEVVKDRVPKMSWEGFSEFYECPRCKKVFWKGAHYNNTVKKLEKIMR